MTTLAQSVYNVGAGSFRHWRGARRGRIGRVRDVCRPFSLVKYTLERPAPFVQLFLTLNAELMHQRPVPFRYFERINTALGRCLATTTKTLHTSHTQ